MEIIEKVDFGDLVFPCKHCETKTKAKFGEYYQAKANDMIDHKSGGFLSRFLGEKTRELRPAWHFEITCPICHNYVVISKPAIGESSFIEAPMAGGGFGE